VAPLFVVGIHRDDERPEDHHHTKRHEEHEDAWERYDLRARSLRACCIMRLIADGGAEGCWSRSGIWEKSSGVYLNEPVCTFANLWAVKASTLPRSAVLGAGI